MTLLTNIQNDEEYQALLDRIKELMSKNNLNAEETKELDTLATLVEKYEDVFYDLK